MPAPVFPNAAVCSPHYLASSAGLAVLTQGGNAVDAAVATNLVLSVAYAPECGPGGDLFAMVWKEGELQGLNSSGRLPANVSLNTESVPKTGIGSATVPGAVAGWTALLDRFGSMSLSDLARPAVRYAREGVPRAGFLRRVTPFFAPLLEKDPDARRTFLSEGPLIQPELADTLERLDDFYTGEPARRAPPPFTPEDFRSHWAEWVEPESLRWQDIEVCEMPPNSRGHLVLRALERLEALEGLTPADAEWHGRLVRAVQAADPAAAPGGGTVYICVRDGHGMAVSMNQSLFEAYGSGVVIPGTGVLLHNRGSYFRPEEYRPGARPVHTLAPAMALRDGEPYLVFGTMGGETQVQIQLQLLTRIHLAGDDVQGAVAAPRWCIRSRRLFGEPGLPDIGAQPLAQQDLFGHAHAIQVTPEGLAASFDPRSDGAAVGY
jgi:gamma-glutamyltranspeptidase/glutathione hydrolase